MTPPRVFISYSHDSDAHRAAILDLANRLRQDGVDAVLDQYVNGSPAQGWPRWMLDELDRATHVLCVCTPTYHRRFRGHEQQGKGKGGTWEGAVITQELYDAGCQNRRFIPVLVGDVDIGSIPLPLRGATRYQVETDFTGLYDAILEQAGFAPPPLGQLKLKDRGSANGSEGAPPTASSTVPTISPPRRAHTRGARLSAFPDGFSHRVRAQYRRDPGQVSWPGGIGRRAFGPVRGLSMEGGSPLYPRWS